jgi:hypothetical protein
MVLEIHEDTDLDFPNRRVSFQTKIAPKTPLTPYNRQRRKCASKPLPAATPKFTTQHVPMEGKENSTNVSSLRRSIRSTMSPTPVASQENVSTFKTPAIALDVDAAPTTTTSPLEGRSPFSPLSSVLRRSMLQSGRLGPPQRIRTPESSNLLNHELDITDADMSLLISPSAMGNPNDVAQSPVERAWASKSTVEEAPATTIGPKEVEVIVKGNGVQMDLSEMFSGIVSPVKDTAAQSDPQLPIVYTCDLRHGVLLDFGDVNVVGQARSMPFIIESSPGSSDDFSLEIERIPFTKGINLVVSDPSSALLKGLSPSVKQEKRLGGPVVPNLLTIKSGEKAVLWVTWTPVESGSVREIILLKLPRGPGRLRITVLGQASAPKEVSFQPDICVDSLWRANDIVPEDKQKNTFFPDASSCKIKLRQRSLYARKNAHTRIAFSSILAHWPFG